MPALSKTCTLNRVWSLITHHNNIATTSAPPFGSLWPPDDTELDRGKREVETGAPTGVSHCDPHHRSYQPILCKSSPVSPSRSTGVEVCQILRVNISPICVANQYITVMENLLFRKQQHMTIAKIKALCSPTLLIADTLLASLLLNLP